MTILPQLERDLFEAARERLPTGDRSVRPRPRRRSIRPSLGNVVAALSVAVALAVGGVAIVLLANHRNPPNRSLASRPPSSGVGSVAALAQLRAHFAVLRRPQTPADQSWGNHSVGLNWRGLSNLTRRLAVLSDGDRIFLTIDQFHGPVPRGLVAPPKIGSLSMTVSLVDKHGDSSGVPDDANSRYTIFPASLEPVQRPRPQHGELGPRLDPGTVWVSLVPDGVSKVRWVFVCGAGRGRCDGFSGSRTIEVPVRDNLAAVPATDSDSCADFACQPATIVWYDAQGDRIATYKDRERGRELVPPAPWKP